MFVYSLVHEGQVFYIGMCEDLAKRYVVHLKCDTTTQTSKYIKYLLDSGKFPEIHIIDRLKLQEATILEANLIQYLSLAGQNITNFQFKRSPLYIKNLPLPITKEIMIKTIRERQKLYIEYHINSPTFMQSPTNYSNQ